MNAAFSLNRNPALTTVGFGLLLLLSSCRTAPMHPETVGPRESRVGFGKGVGSLVVYSDTEERRLDIGIPYYLHTCYLIESSSGELVRWVENHVGDMDQQPQTVRLGSGKYVIVAESSSYGRVYVPVVIEPGHVTELHLDGAWTPAPDRTLVLLPDGEPIGWRAKLLTTDDSDGPGLKRRQ
jgi:hypothetical protein